MSIRAGARLTKTSRDEDFALGVLAQSTQASGVSKILHFGTNEWCSAKFVVEAAIA